MTELTYKIVALDMDGTLLSHDKGISETNRYWIRKATEAGVHVCIATGRGQPSIVPYYEDLGLTTPFVAVNGGEVWKDARTLHDRVSLEHSTVVSLHALAVKHGTWYWAYGENGLYSKDQWIDDIKNEQWMKFCYFCEDERVLAEISREIASMGQLEVTNSDPLNIEVNPPGVTKASGLRRICALLGCKMEEVIAAGDSLNDMAMIREAGLGVAMGNAQDTVKSQADTVAPTCDEDGVAAIIRRYIFNEE